MSTRSGFVGGGAEGTTTTIDWTVVIFEFVCPTLGVIISNFMYAAPVGDLRKALQTGRLGDLNPFPWAVMTGNCFGWLTYAWYARDPFILASNVPGLLVSFFLNFGASKLQYLEQQQQQQQVVVADITATTNEHATAGLMSSNNNSNHHHHQKNRRVFTPQEVLFLCITSLWAMILVSVGWLGVVARGHEQATIGILVNINLIFFYGAPLQTMSLVVREKNANSIHAPTMFLNWANTTFWMMYGFARNDIVIWGPNGLGLCLGIVQGSLCCIYPRTSSSATDVDVDPTPLLSGHDANSHGEEEEIIFCSHENGAVISSGDLV